MLENLDVVLAFTMIMLLLSLLATIVVQMVVSLLGLRGRNLFWAVQQLFLQAAPGAGEKIERKAGQLAGAVLGHAILSPHAAIRQRLKAGKPWRGRYGPTALRLEDLELVFRQLQSRGSGEFQQLLADQVAESAPSSEWVEAVVGRLKEAFPEKAEQLDEAARDGLATAQRLGEVIDALRKVVPEQVDRVEQVAKEAMAEAGAWGRALEEWFEMAMDAAHERFKMWSRWITAGAAALLAFGFQIDSIDILRQLSDQDVRARVLSQVETVQALSEATFAQKDADSDARKGHEDLQRALGETRAALRETGLEIFGPPFWECAHWRTQVRGRPDAEAAANDPADRPYIRRAGGSLATALLLSLGAPFWYGTFKKLLSLRSIVAEKQEARSGSG